MRLSFCAVAFAITAMGCFGCGAQTTAQIEAASQPAARTVPPEIRAAAATLLGAGTEVLAFGDLARNGREQALVANRSKEASNKEAGIRFTRAAILERERKKWVEILRCDEYLKNPNGYLGGIPLEPATSWWLEFGGKDKNDSPELLFTPLQMPGARPITTVAVRWNPRTNRYQSIDRKSGRFLAELPSLETPRSPLR
jgi:hypothetical protein